MTTVESAPDGDIRVLIIANVRLYRDGLVSLLQERKHFQIIGATDACDVVHRTSVAADVVIIDMSTPGALAAVSALSRDATCRKIVAFAIQEDESQIIACVEAGAAGYVTAESSIDDLINVVESIARDELVCSPRIAALFARRLTELSSVDESSAADASLTGREWQVVRLLREGLSNKEIGQALHISDATVKNHVHHLLGKLQVTSRRQAVARLAKARTLPPRPLRA